MSDRTCPCWSGGWFWEGRHARPLVALGRHAESQESPGPSQAGRVARPCPCPCPVRCFSPSPPVGSHLWLLSSLQSLSIKTSSLAEAENMADLVDGYCRLQGEHKGSLIIHPKKGAFPPKGEVAQGADGGTSPQRWSGRRDTPDQHVKEEALEALRGACPTQPDLGVPLWVSAAGLAPSIHPSIRPASQGQHGGWLLEERV